MAYVVTATWKATPDGVGVVREALKELAPSSREEAACLSYIVYSDREDPLTFNLFEVYENEAGYEAHGASDHFKRLAIESAIPNLASRERRFFETVDV